VRHSSFVILLCLLSGCGKPVEPARSARELEPPLALAHVGEHVITAADFRQHWEQKRPATDDAATRSKVLDELVSRAAIAAKAHEVGLEDDPAVRAGVRKLLIARLRELQLQPRLASIEITEPDLQAAYDRMKETRFRVPARVKVAALWLDPHGDADREARWREALTKAREATLADAIPPDKGFGAHSIRASEHRASRYRGGVLDWLAMGRTQDAWQKAVIDIAATLETPGEMSDITATDQGLLVVRLIERRAAQMRSLADVKKTLQRELTAQRRREVEAAFEQECRQHLAIRVNHSRLTELEDLPTRPAGSKPAFALRKKR